MIAGLAALVRRTFGLSDLLPVSTVVNNVNVQLSFVPPLETGVAGWEMESLHRAGAARFLREARHSEHALRNLIAGFDQVTVPSHVPIQAEYAKSLTDAAIATCLAGDLSPHSVHRVADMARRASVEERLALFDPGTYHCDCCCCCHYTGD